MPNDAATLVARPPLLPVRAGCLPWRTRGASDVSHASTATTACPSSARSPSSMATAGWESRPPPRRPPTTTRTLERAGLVLVRVSEVLLQGASSMNVRSGGRGAGVSEGCSERELERELWRSAPGARGPRVQRGHACVRASDRPGPSCAPRVWPALLRRASPARHRQPKPTSGPTPSRPSRSASHIPTTSAACSRRHGAAGTSCGRGSRSFTSRRPSV